MSSLTVIYVFKTLNNFEKYILLVLNYLFEKQTYNSKQKYKKQLKN